MSPFPQEAQFENAGFINGERIIRLTAPLVVISSIGVHEVPKGFESDGASIPRFARSIIGSPFDRWLEDGIFHDWLYAKASDHLSISRKQADNLFRETMWNHDHIDLWKIASAWSALRMFGGRNYKRR